MTRVLVTGGAGFIGSAMVEYLLEHHPDVVVRVMDLNRPPAEGIEKLTGSILDSNDISNAVRDCDYVVHMAAMLGVKRTEMRRFECLNINIQGTVNVLEACVKERVKKVLFVSSSEVYGDPRENPVRETTPVNPKSVYAVSKLAGEEYVKAYRAKYGLGYSIVRFFNVYGPRQVAEFVMPRFIKAVMEDRPPTVYGNGHQARAFCYVTDAVRGAAATLFDEGTNSEIFNVGNDLEPIWMKDLAFKVIALARKEITPRFVPMADSDRTASREIQKRVPDLSKARAMLRYEPEVGLDEGIRRVMAYVPIEESWFDPMEW